MLWPTTITANIPYSCRSLAVKLHRVLKPTQKTKGYQDIDSKAEPNWIFIGLRKVLRASVPVPGEYIQIRRKFLLWISMIWYDTMTTILIGYAKPNPYIWFVGIRSLYLCTITWNRLRNEYLSYNFVCNMRQNDQLLTWSWKIVLVLTVKKSRP